MQSTNYRQGGGDYAHSPTQQGIRSVNPQPNLQFSIAPERSLAREQVYLEKGLQPKIQQIQEVSFAELAHQGSQPNATQQKATKSLQSTRNDLDNPINGHPPQKQIATAARIHEPDKQPRPTQPATASGTRGRCLLCDVTGHDTKECTSLTDLPVDQRPEPQPSKHHMLGGDCINPAATFGLSLNLQNPYTSEVQHAILGKLYELQQQMTHIQAMNMQLQHQNWQIQEQNAQLQYQNMQLQHQVNGVQATSIQFQHQNALFQDQNVQLQKQACEIQTMSVQQHHVMKMEIDNRFQQLQLHTKQGFTMVEEHLKTYVPTDMLARQTPDSGVEELQAEDEMPKRKKPPDADVNNHPRCNDSNNEAGFRQSETWRMHDSRETSRTLAKESRMLIQNSNAKQWSPTVRVEVQDHDRPADDHHPMQATGKGGATDQGLLPTQNGYHDELAHSLEQNQTSRPMDTYHSAQPRDPTESGHYPSSLKMEMSQSNSGRTRLSIAEPAIDPQPKQTIADWNEELGELEAEALMSLETQEATQGEQASMQKTLQTTLLPTAVVKVLGIDGKAHEARIFLDKGDSPPMTTYKFTQQRLGMTPERVARSVAEERYNYARQPNRKALHEVTLTLIPRVESSFSIQVDTLVTETLDGDYPENQTVVELPEEFDRSLLADPDFETPAPIDMIVNKMVMRQLCQETQHFPGCPMLIPTPLGYLAVVTDRAAPTTERSSTLQERSETQPIESEAGNALLTIAPGAVIGMVREPLRLLYANQVALFPTTWLMISAPDSTGPGWSVRSLCDSGSDPDVVSHEAACRLGINYTPMLVPVTDYAGRATPPFTHGVRIKIKSNRSRRGAPPYELIVEALVAHALDGKYPMEDVRINFPVNYHRGLYADPHMDIARPIDMILGTRTMAKILHESTPQSPIGQVQVFDTPFGLMLWGSAVAVRTTTMPGQPLARIGVLKKEQLDVKQRVEAISDTNTENASTPRDGDDEAITQDETAQNKSDSTRPLDPNQLEAVVHPGHAPAENCDEQNSGPQQVLDETHDPPTSNHRPTIDLVDTMNPSMSSSAPAEELPHGEEHTSLAIPTKKSGRVIPDIVNVRKIITPDTKLKQNSAASGSMRDTCLGRQLKDEERGITSLATTLEANQAGGATSEKAANSAKHTVGSNFPPLSVRNTPNAEAAPKPETKQVAADESASTSLTVKSPTLTPTHAPTHTPTHIEATVKKTLFTYSLKTALDHFLAPASARQVCGATPPADDKDVILRQAMMFYIGSLENTVPEPDYTNPTEVQNFTQRSMQYLWHLMRIPHTTQLTTQLQSSTAIERPSTSATADVTRTHSAAFCTPAAVPVVDSATRDCIPQVVTVDVSTAPTPPSNGTTAPLTNPNTDDGDTPPSTLQDTNHSVAPTSTHQSIDNGVAPPLTTPKPNDKPTYSPLNRK